MFILNWYVTRGFLVAFSMAIAVLTFGMTGANLVQVLRHISQGFPLSTFFEITLCLMPMVLTFTIPWAVLVGVMLVFGRLSADSEITAMRACGVSILQIVSPIMLITIALTGLCLYLHAEAGPPLLGYSRAVASNSVLSEPQALFVPGAPIIQENSVITISDRDENGTLYGLQIYQLNNDDELVLDITAATGKIEVDREKQRLIVRMFDCLLVDKKSKPENRSFSKELEFSFDYGKLLNGQRVTERAKYMTFRNLMAHINLVKLTGADTTKLEIELNQRIAFALAPIAFLLLGIPLAIRTSRRETSVGLFLSVILAGVFFLSIIVCESLEDYPKLYPQYLLWLPNIVFQCLGAYMTYRISKR